MDNELKVYDVADSLHEKKAIDSMIGLFKNSPIPDKEILDHLGIYIRRHNITRILAMHELYTKILAVKGIVMEFGVRWGQNLSLFSNFRGIHEPYHHQRKIIGFDTFSGFPSVCDKDGGFDNISKHKDGGGYSVTKGYENHLDDVLKNHEDFSPISHIKKYELIKGDATKTCKEYLEKHPETIISFAYFDFDIYEPTKICLELILPYLTKGSIIGFDNLQGPYFPGETVALREVLGLSKYSIQRSQFSPRVCFITI